MFRAIDFVKIPLMEYSSSLISFCPKRCQVARVVQGLLLSMAVPMVGALSRARLAVSMI
jgi:hypothetical protein